MDPQAIFDNYRRILSRHYFDMNGRVGRAEFWYFVLANLLASILAGIVGNIVGLPLGEIYNLAMLFPTAGMGARRLQDIGRDGKLIWIFIFAGFISQFVAMTMMMTSWFPFGFLSFFLFGPMLVLINLALLVACVVLIYFWCQPGDPGDNAYGPPPPVFDPSVRVPTSP